MRRAVYGRYIIVKNPKSYEDSGDYTKISNGGEPMTVVCVDDHSVMLEGVKKSVEQILPDASIAAFSNADAALAYAKENGCDVICQCDFGQSRSAACAAAILQHFEGRGIDIFADYRYYPNQLVYHKIFDALERMQTKAVK
jgi:hypothetical protein